MNFMSKMIKNEIYFVPIKAKKKFPKGKGGQSLVCEDST